MDIVTIGEVLIDLTQTGRDERGIPQFAANPGGAPANLAVAAAKLGAQTTFIGKVGEDAFGRYLTEVLQENKVDTRYMVTDADHPTTMAVVSVDASGERDFSFYRSANADVMLRKEDIPEEALKAAKIVHFPPHPPRWTPPPVPKSWGQSSPTTPTTAPTFGTARKKRLHR